MKQIINHFTDNDLYTFTCQYYILQNYPRAEVEYSFFDRNKTKYPAGFADMLREQLDNMSNVVITQDEMDFMTKKCPFLPFWYINVFLHGYRFNPNELTITQDEEGYLDIKVKGKWWSTIMWEMPILSTISEMMHILNGDINKYDAALEYKRAYDKAHTILTNGLTLGDMGTRRRFSFAHQDLVLQAFKDQDLVLQAFKDVIDDELLTMGTFTGTSNVWFAMKHDFNVLGTMSHQIISFEETVSGVFECNFNTMNKWSETFDGSCGIFLYDCFGDDLFFHNLSKRMAMMFSGLRVDSGKEEEQIEKIINKYKQLGIDPTTKQVVFSNGLDIARAIEIHKYCDNRVKDSYGVGTFLTCDVSDCKPMNIVVKLTKCRITEFREWHNCVKLSSDRGKMLGDADKCKYLMSLMDQ